MQGINASWTIYFRNSSPLGLYQSQNPTGIPKSGKIERGLMGLAYESSGLNYSVVQIRNGLQKWMLSNKQFQVFGGLIENLLEIM
jgi:hypothetical protein